MASLTSIGLTTAGSNKPTHACHIILYYTVLRFFTLIISNCYILHLNFNGTLNAANDFIFPIYSSFPPLLSNQMSNFSFEKSGTRGTALLHTIIWIHRYSCRFMIYILFIEVYQLQPSLASFIRTMNCSDTDLLQLKPPAFRTFLAFCFDKIIRHYWF